MFKNGGFGDIEEYDDSQDLFQGHYTIDASNQFFTRADIVKHGSYYPYDDDEDPHGSLHAVYEDNEGRVVRTEDNDVLYRQAVYVTAEDGTK